MKWYYTIFDLNMSVGQYDLCLMVQWFCFISERAFDIWKSYFQIIKWYYTVFHLSMTLSHFDLYFMVQWFCPVSERYSIDLFTLSARLNSGELLSNAFVLLYSRIWKWSELHHIWGQGHFRAVYPWTSDMVILHKYCFKHLCYLFGTSVRWAFKGPLVFNKSLAKYFWVILSPIKLSVYCLKNLFSNGNIKTLTNEQQHEKTNIGLTRSRTNQAVQPLELARGLKFRI